MCLNQGRGGGEGGSPSDWPTIHKRADSLQ